MTSVIRPVSLLVFETKCHNDELVARFLGIEFGEAVLPGFGKSAPIFSENCARQSAEYWAQRKIFCIGCGGDTTDEHTHGAGDRQKGKCAATLMAELVGVTADLAVQKIVEETLLFDSGTGCPRGHLAEFVKAVHRRQPGGELTLMKWHQYWVKAVYDRLTLEPSPRNGRKEKTLSERIGKIMAAKSAVFPDDNIKSRIVQDMKVIEGLGDKFVLGLPFILQSLERTNRADDDIDASLAFFAGIMYQEQTAFRALRKLADKKARRDRIPAVLNGRDSNLTLITLVTDDELALKVLLNIGADLALIISTDGHPVILRNEKVEGLSLNTARGMIRWLELEKGADGKPIILKGTDGKLMDLSFEALEAFEGTHPAVPQWYGVSYMMANGTTTHRGVPRTNMIADAAPRDVLLHAFHPRLIKQWKEARRIGIPLSNPVISIVRDESSPSEPGVQAA
jgi:hypothetical protein